MNLKSEVRGLRDDFDREGLIFLLNFPMCYPSEIEAAGIDAEIDISAFSGYNAGSCFKGGDRR